MSADKHSETAVPEVVQMAIGSEEIFALPRALNEAVRSSISKLKLSGLK